MNEFAESQGVCPACGQAFFHNRADCLQTESRLSGRYIIGRMLGKGRNTVSYIARDTVLDKKVVVKEYFPVDTCERSGSQPFINVKDKTLFITGMKNFAAKTRQMALYRDINCAPVYYDLIKENNTVYAVREYVEGVNAIDIVHSGTMDAGGRLNVIEKVTGFLSAVNSAGDPHCDVKPENVIIGNDGRITVTDFAVPTVTIQGMVYDEETPFSAPELKSTGVPDEKCDVYSASVLAYYLLTNIAPDMGSKRAASDTAVNPMVLNPDVDPALAEAIIAGMKPDPVQRTQTVTEFEAAAIPSSIYQQATVEVPPMELDVPGLGGVQDISTETVDAGFADDAAIPAPADEIGIVPAAVPAAGEMPAAESIDNSFDDEAKVIRPLADGPDIVQRKKKASPALFAIIAAAAVILVFGGIFAVSKLMKNDGGKSLKNSSNSEDIYVPDFLSGNLTFDEAKALAGKDGLFVEIFDQQYSDDVPEGAILNQDPASGVTIKKGGIVYLTLSAGKENKTVTISKYVGMKSDEIIAELEEKGIIINQIDDYDSLFANGIITKQGVESGTVLNAGDTLDLWISANDDNKEFPSGYHSVPDFKNVDIENIKSVVDADFFAYEEPIYEYNSKYAEGIVFDQSPKAGEVKENGTKITLYVSKGKKVLIVPNIQYKTRDEATMMLKLAGFTESDYEFKNEDSDTVSKDRVTRTSPEANTELEADKKLTVYISNGPTYSSNDDSNKNTAEERTEPENELDVDDHQNDQETGDQEVNTTTKSPEVVTTIATTTQYVPPTAPPTEPPTEPPTDPTTPEPTTTTTAAVVKTELPDSLNPNGKPLYWAIETLKNNYYVVVCDQYENELTQYDDDAVVTGYTRNGDNVYLYINVVE